MGELSLDTDTIIDAINASQTYDCVVEKIYIKTDDPIRKAEAVKRVAHLNKKLNRLGEFYLERAFNCILIKCKVNIDYFYKKNL